MRGKGGMKELGWRSQLAWEGGGVTLTIIIIISRHIINGGRGWGSCLKREDKPKREWHKDKKGRVKPGKEI